MSAHPNPNDSFRIIHAKRPVMIAYSDRLKLPCTFQMQGRVARIVLQELIVLVGQIANMLRQ